jgi:hypothetical protein
MTPKEKAEELFKQYYSYLKANLMNDREAWEDAKECALIAVNLHLEELSKMKLIFSDRELHYKFWQEVEQEIQFL